MDSGFGHHGPEEVFALRTQLRRQGDVRKQRIMIWPSLSASLDSLPLCAHGAQQRIVRASARAIRAVNELALKDELAAGELICREAKSAVVEGISSPVAART